MALVLEAVNEPEGGGRALQGRAGKVEVVRGVETVRAEEMMLDFSLKWFSTIPTKRGFYSGELSGTGGAKGVAIFKWLLAKFAEGGVDEVEEARNHPSTCLGVFSRVNLR